MTLHEPPRNGRPRRVIKGRRSWGALIKDIREKKRRYTRAEVIARFQAELASIDPNYNYNEVISEAWLSRAEKDTILNVDQRTLHLLCRALGCTPIERMQVMFAADRNTLLADSGEMTEELLLITYLAHSLAADQAVRKLIRKLMRNQHFFDLSDSDRNLIIGEVLKVVKPPEPEPVELLNAEVEVEPRAREHGATQERPVDQVAGIIDSRGQDKGQAAANSGAQGEE